MNRALLTLGFAAACVGLTACADGYYGGDYGPRHAAYYEHHPIGYEGYYDGHYGPFYDGYWGDGGQFYYSTGEGQPFVVDRENHFRRDSYGGYAPFRGGMHVGVRRGG